MLIVPAGLLYISQPDHDGHTTTCLTARILFLPLNISVLQDLLVFCPTVRAPTINIHTMHASYSQVKSG